MQRYAITRSGIPKNCFVWAMRVMEQDLRAAGAMNWEFALEKLQSLKSTFEVYGYSHSARVRGSTCNLCSNVAVREVVWNVVELLMASLEELNQRDGNIAAELLRLTFYFTIWCTTVRSHGVSYHTGLNLTSVKLPVLSERKFRLALKAAYSLQHPVIVHNDHSHDNKQNIVWFAIMECQEQLLSALLRYGMMLLPATEFSEIDLWRFEEALLCLDRHSRWSFASQNAFLDSCRRQLRWPLHRVIMVSRVLVILSDEVCEGLDAGYKDPFERKRLRLENKGERSASGYGYFRCLRRVFETIPEPFVTSEELRRVFQAAFGDVDLRREIRINRLLAEFERLYPEGAEPFVPRTLQHLSRCQVRQNLRQTGELPQGIKRLGLPNKIRKYIALEE